MVAKNIKVRKRGSGGWTPTMGHHEDAGLAAVVASVPGWRDA